jgi:hypothetical protein
MQEKKMILGWRGPAQPRRPKFRPCERGVLKTIKYQGRPLDCDTREIWKPHEVLSENDPVSSYAEALRSPSPEASLSTSPSSLSMNKRKKENDLISEK